MIKVRRRLYNESPAGVCHGVITVAPLSTRTPLLLEQPKEPLLLRGIATGLFGRCTVPRGGEEAPSGHVRV